jgi:hypothetical protein
MPSAVAHICNLNYSGHIGRRIVFWQNQRALSKKNNLKAKRAVVQDPEFQSQYPKKKKNYRMQNSKPCNLEFVKYYGRRLNVCRIKKNTTIK